MDLPLWSCTADHIRADRSDLLLSKPHACSAVCPTPAIGLNTDIKAASHLGPKTSIRQRRRGRGLAGSTGKTYGQLRIWVCTQGGKRGTKISMMIGPYHCLPSKPTEPQADPRAERASLADAAWVQIQSAGESSP